MIHWRHEEDKKRKGDEKSRPASNVPSNFNSDASISYGRTTAVPLRARDLPPTRAPTEGPPYMPQDATSFAGLYPPGWSSDPSQSSEIGSSSWQLTASKTAKYFPRYKPVKASEITRNQNWMLHYVRTACLVCLPVKASEGSAVIHYEQSEVHEERQLRKLISGLATFYNIGGLPDPFDVMPQFRNPRLNALYLSRNCKFEQTAKKPGLNVSRHARVCF